MIFACFSAEMQGELELVRTVGNGDLMHEVYISYNIPRAWEQHG